MKKGTGVPKAYKSIRIDTLEKDTYLQNSNSGTYSIIKKYITDINTYVREKALGLFLFSVPSVENKLGTGTGKTTTATAILNEYVLDRFYRGLHDGDLNENIGYFIRLSQFQNKYNEQFKGTQNNQRKASDLSYRYKERMKKSRTISN